MSNPLPEATTQTREQEQRRTRPAPPTGPGRLARRARRRADERSRAQRRLAWLLCAPEVVVMLAVTAYPIGYAFWLSLQRYDLRFPEESEFIGLRNYLDVLTAELWWQDVFNTTFVTVVSVALELVLGMVFALVMHRAILGRRTVRTSILVPYGIITVVAALAWQYAFTPNLGFVNSLFNIEDPWLTSAGRRSR